MSRESDKFERDLAEMLGEHGFWATVIPKADDGTQPCDIIACNKLFVHLIDAKLCDTGRFVFSRAEENQRSSMEFIKRRANGHGWFALKYPDGKIYMIPKSFIEYKESVGTKSLSEIPDYYSLEYWLNVYSDK